MGNPEHEPVHGSAAETQPADVTPLTRDELLAEVLGETLARRQEDPDGLLDALRAWKENLADPRFSPDVLEGLVGQVLRHRLGDKAEKLPARLRSEVSGVLWNDPASRQRIERLWTDLGASP